MRMFISLILAGLLTPLFSTCLVSAQSDALWEKSVQLFSMSEKMVPGKINMTMEMKDKKGTLLDTHETIIKIFLGSDGKPDTEILSETSNGEKVIQQNPTETEGESMSMSISADQSVFHPDNQEKLALTKLNETKMLGSVKASGYEFRLAMDEENNLAGTAWLDSETGRPLQVIHTLDPLPKHVKEIETVDTYTLDDSNHLVLSRTEVTGMGGFLFIKRYFHSIITMSEHWEYIETEKENEENNSANPETKG